MEKISETIKTSTSRVTTEITIDQVKAVVALVPSHLTLG